MKDHPARVSNPEANGLRHLAFKVHSVVNTVTELEQKGIKGLITYKNRLNKRVWNKDTMFFTLNELITKYIVKTYGNKKRTTSQHKKSLRISNQ